MRYRILYWSKTRNASLLNCKEKIIIPPSGYMTVYHMTVTCKASHWLAYLPPLIFVLLRLLIATKMVSAFADGYNFHIWKRSCLQFWGDFEMNDKCQTDGEGRHKTITMWIIRSPEIFMVVKIRYFSATYLEALSTSISSSHQWKKKSPPPKKHWWMTSQTVNQCVNLKSKLQLKCFIVLESVIYSSVSTTV